MTAPLIKILDKKQALTKKEAQEVEEELRKATEVKATFIVHNLSSNKVEHFHAFRIKKFETYPQFIGLIHEKFGRRVDLNTFYADNEYIDLHIRGYAKELNR